MGPSPIRLRNSAREDPDNPGWWRWSVWVAAPDKVIRQIKSVEYTLHPTFADPVRKRTNWRTNFRLDSAGWGEFTLHARVEMKDGTRRRLTYGLKLREGQESGAREAVGSRRKGARTRPTRIPAKGRRKTTEKAVSVGTWKETAELARRPKRVFISHSVSDRPFVSELRKHLTDHNVESVTAETHIPPGVPWGDWLRRIIATSDAVMVLLGQTPNAGVATEAGIAFALKRRVISVTLGDAVTPPREFGEPVHLDPGPNAAETLALRVTSMLTA